MYQNLHFYIDLNWEGIAENPKDFFQKTFALVEFIYQHKSQVFYSKEQIDEFVVACGILDEGFSQSYGNMLGLILENAKCINQKKYVFEINFNEENTSLNFINIKTFACIENHDRVAIASVVQKESLKIFLAIKSNTEFYRINCNILNSTDSVHNWILSNIPKRNFNLSSKHGENGIHNWKSASVLLCKKDEAQHLLDIAIPDFRKNPNLFYFDKNNDKYIEFFYEGDNPQNQWHGFHIEEKDIDSRVPKSIRDYFQK